MLFWTILLIHCNIAPFISAAVINENKLSSSSSDNPDICETPLCYETATELRQYMDSTVDPCDDFYQFACGKFEEVRPKLSKGQTDLGINSDQDNLVYLQLNELFRRPLDDSEPEFVKLVKNLYASCMNKERIEEVKDEPLKQLLKSLGGWPVVEGENWDASNFDWLDLVLKAKEKGAFHYSLLTVQVDTDNYNKKRRSVWVSPPSFGIDREHLLHDGNATKAYFDKMVKVANKLGANTETSEKELLDVLNFEIGLANITTPSRKIYYNTVKGTKRNFIPQVDLLKLINGLLHNQITEQEKIYLLNPFAVKDLIEYIFAADKRTLANYVIWRSVLHSLHYLSKDWRDLMPEPEKQNPRLIGLPKELQEIRKCADSVNNIFYIPVSWYYLKNYFDPGVKDKATEILNYVHQEFVKILENVDWMNEDTRKEAIDKANAIYPFIGYPEELLDETLISNMFKNISASPDEYFNNDLKIMKFANDFISSYLRKPVDKYDWTDHAKVAHYNAHYQPASNAIAFLAAFLQKPLFNKDGLTFMNFARLGATMGHEITHGFDNRGRLFDKYGDLKKWWDNTTDKKFMKKAKCMVDQYANYTAANGLKINGLLTLGENIADNGGFKEAYRAYNTWVKDNGPELKLPGLNYTNNQLFWVGLANLWCSKISTEFLTQIMMTNPHSPSRFRVIGPMSNLAEFSQDFNCPLGSGMNPHKKCVVW